MRVRTISVCVPARAATVFCPAGLLWLFGEGAVAAQRPGPPPPPPQCTVPAVRPWEFLDASTQIQQIPDTTSTKIFRTIQPADFNQDGQQDVVAAQAVSAAG